jgi:hypothetical protein
MQTIFIRIFLSLSASYAEISGKARNFRLKITRCENGDRNSTAGNFRRNAGAETGSASALPIA